SDFKDWRDCSISIKAVSENAVSELSNAVTISNNGAKSKNPTAADNAGAEMTVKTGARKIVKDGANPDFDENGYVSTYDYLYTIKSDYQAAVAVTSSSVSLSANSFYKISVWVKTEDAKATIALTGTGGSVEANLSKDNVIGYSNIKTDGNWEEFVIYIKTGNFSVSPSINLCLGNPYGKSHKVTDADKLNYYDADDLSFGSVYFDVVRVAEINEEEYEIAEDRIKNNNGLLKAEDKLLYKEATTHAYAIRYTIDSFDSWTKVTTDADKYGNTPDNYTRSNGDNVDSSDATSANMTYGIYNANVDASDENMYSALSYLYGNGDKMLFNNYFKFAENYTEEEWRTLLKDFLSLKNDELVKNGGNNVLVLSNKLASGTAQMYKLDSGYNVSIAADGYYKLTFAANTLIAKPVFTKTTVPEAHRTSWSANKSKYYVKSGSKFILAYTDAYVDGTDYYTVTYTYDDCYAEMRFASGETNATDLKMYLSSYSKNQNNNETFYGSKTYTLYIYNQSSSAKTASWKFYLGDGNTVKDGVYSNMLVGMLAIDLVSMEKIDKDQYAAGVEGKYDAEGNLVEEHGNVMKYEYAADEKSSSGDNNKDDNGGEEEPKEKEDFWKRLIEDDYFWLYISSVVLAIVIIVVVIVVLVRKYKEKHPKKVVGENNVKTVKDYKDVVEPEAQEKVEALEADE
ncbi:MAG: hypothetical protein J5781_08455, partial [Clostridia bacterium]|nr:hypothetical protein [Clostridia bacterium]